VVRIMRPERRLSLDESLECLASPDGVALWTVFAVTDRDKAASSVSSSSISRSRRTDRYFSGSRSMQRRTISRESRRFENCLGGVGPGSLGHRSTRRRDRRRGQVAVLWVAHSAGAWNRNCTSEAFHDNAMKPGRKHRVAIEFVEARENAEANASWTAS